MSCSLTERHPRPANLEHFNYTIAVERSYGSADRWPALF